MNSIKKVSGGFAKFVKALLNVLVIGILLFSIISVPICMFVYIKGYSWMFSVKELIWIFPAAIYTAVVFLIGKNLQNKKEQFLIISMILIEVAYVTFLLIFYNTQPCSDYTAIWNAAIEMSKGVFTDGLKNGSYMYIYNWQLGIAAFESILINLFGENFFALKIFSAIITAVNNYLIYKCCCVKFNRKIGVYAYVTATMFIPWMLSVPQFTNHHIGFTLLLISLLLINKNKWYTYLAAGVVIAFLNVLRPMGIILIIAAFCKVVYNMFNEHSWKGVAKNAGRFALLLLAFAVVITGFNITFIKKEYTDMNISSARVPYFKFQKGLYGYQSPFEDYNKYEDVDSYNEAMKENLVKKIKNHPISICIFVTGKMIRYVGLVDYQFEMTFDQNNRICSKYPVKAFYSTSWFFYAFSLIISIIAFIKKRKENDVDVFTIFFIGNTLVYIIIEAFSSYRFESYYYIIMFMAVGFAMFADWIDKKIND